MEWSQHNIFAPIAESDKHILINLLTQQADIIDPKTALEINQKNIADPAPFIEKGYLVDPDDEKKLFKQRYLDFIDTRESDEVQIFFVPWYNCNFACSYCYQDEYTNDQEKITDAIIESFFDYIDKNFAHRRKYITIFGGEPLLDSAYHRDIISSLVSKAHKRDLGIAVVTNGYHLSSYIDILKQGTIREIQITLDGTAELQDTRRPLKNGSKSFNAVKEGIDAALMAKLPVNLRVVIDRENLPNLPALAKFSKEAGWLDNPLLKTQLGRNYELHHCQHGNINLYSRIEMYQELYALGKKEPIIYDFHRPAYSISRFLFDNGSLPDPLFDSCPGAKTEWAFDYTGSIYSCTATVGTDDEKLGTFYPEISLDEESIAAWEERDVTTIPQCTTCPQRLACGGGCAAVAKNNEGTLKAPDCRPIPELLSLGIAAYFNNEKESSNEK